MPQHRPRPRSDLRRSLAILAFAAVASWAEVGLWLRADHFRHLQRVHLEKAFMAVSESSRLGRLSLLGGEGAGRSAARSALEGRRAAYHSALARKYRDAADHPWLIVAPDPPEPT